MRKISLAIFILVALFILGCSDNENPYGFDEVITTTESSTTDNDINETSSEHLAGSEDKVLDMKYYAQGGGMSEELGVDKTLIFLTESSQTAGVDPDIYRKFNELLVNKYGCDFTVEFRGYSVGSTGEYQEEIRTMKALGAQVDILHTGSESGEYDNKVYDEAIRDGLLEPLTGRLGTEQGEKLWKAYRETTWNSIVRDGEYYGVSNHLDLGGIATIIINKEYVKDVDEVKNIKTIEDVLAFLDTIENVEKGIIPLVATESGIAKINNWYEFDYGIDLGILARESDGKWEAFFASQDEEYLEQLMSIREYGLGGSQSYARDSGKFVVSITNNFISSYNENTTIVYDKETKETKLMDIYLCNEVVRSYEYMSNNVMGIASWSQYKDEAFELLTLIATEPELANLLAFGLEGVHYRLENGIAVETEQSEQTNGRNPQVMWSAGNHMIRYPYNLETVDKADRYNEVADKATLGLKSLCDIDISAYYGDIDRMENFMEDYSGWLYKENYRELLAEIQSGMKALGIDDLINEINRQLSAAQK